MPSALQAMPYIVPHSLGGSYLGSRYWYSSVSSSQLDKKSSQYCIQSRVLVPLCFVMCTHSILLTLDLRIILVQCGIQIAFHALQVLHEGCALLPTFRLL